MTPEQREERLRFLNDKVRKLEKALRDLGLAIKEGTLDPQKAMADIRAALTTPRRS